mgnify:CR=1 FL=1
MNRTIVSDDEFLRRIRAGDRKAQEEFVRKNQGLVIHIARRYAYTPDIMRDLIAEGNMGLLKAIEKYDEKKQVKFGTYAYFWIKRFVLRAVMKDFEIFKIPERLQEFRDRFEEVRRECRLRKGREPSDAEVAAELRLPPEVFRKMKKYGEHIRVVSPQVTSQDRDGDLFEFVEFRKDEEVSLWEILRNKDMVERVFARLRAREKRADTDLWIKAVRMHYGLIDGTPYSYKEIAEKLRVSRQRVHQIIKTCLRKLQKEWKEITREGSSRLYTGHT